MPLAHTQTNQTSGDVLGQKLFSIALVADTHLNQGEMLCNSPFPVNALANARSRYVIDSLNQQDIDFVVNLGDLIHPVPAVPDLYESAVKCFKDQLKTLKCPIHLVPGNHDIGDKPNDWAPTGLVKDEYIALWEKHFGAHYYAIEHKGSHFIIINAQIIDSGLDSEFEQKAWLENYLQQYDGERLFIHLHYPPYLTTPDEPVNYDNLPLAGRQWLLNLLETYRVEALFAGHVHNFWYNRYGVTDCYLLPSTAFVRQDYAEMYRTPPHAEDEAGRNDMPKLGYFIMHVHEHGHLIEVVRTWGNETKPDQTSTLTGELIKPIHPLHNQQARFGFDLRHDWIETIEIPPSGGLDEFDRKAVRNDYATMALWEMGVRQLRIPLRDFLIESKCERLRVLHDHGFEYTLFSFGNPTEEELNIILNNHEIIHNWEIAYTDAVLDQLIPTLEQIKQHTQINIYLSPLHSKADVQQSGRRYYHTISHGGTEQNIERVLETVNSLKTLVDGMVYRVAEQESPLQALQTMQSTTKQYGIKALLHIRMKGENPAGASTDDSQFLTRTTQALLGALTHKNCTVFIDSFIDNDRGYFVNHGVLDRLYNPRSAFHIIRYIHALLGKTSASIEYHLLEQQEQLESYHIKAGQDEYLLTIGQTATTLKLPSELKQKLTHQVDFQQGRLIPLQDTELTLDSNQPVHLFALK